MVQFCTAATGPHGRYSWSIIPPPLTLDTARRKLAGVLNVPLWTLR